MRQKLKKRVSNLQRKINRLESCVKILTLDKDNNNVIAKIPVFSPKVKINIFQTFLSLIGFVKKEVEEKKIDVAEYFSQTGTSGEALKIYWKNQIESIHRRKKQNGSTIGTQKKQDTFFGLPKLLG